MNAPYSITDNANNFTNIASDPQGLRSYKKDVGINMTQSGAVTHLKYNYASKYNFVANLYNKISVEVKFKNRLQKRNMRGGRFFLLNPLIVTYLIYSVVSLIIGWASLLAASLILSVLYLVITGYNIYVFKQNANIQAANFIQDAGVLPYGFNNEIYEIQINNPQQARTLAAHWSFICGIARDCNIQGPFEVMFYRDIMKRYTKTEPIISFALYIFTCTLIAVLSIYRMV